MQQAFKPGYFLSNGKESSLLSLQIDLEYTFLSDPGFYQEGEFGIRLENVLEVIEKPWLKYGGQKFFGFKVITLVPFETNLIKFDLISPQQVRVHSFQFINYLVVYFIFLTNDYYVLVTYYYVLEGS